MVNFSLETMEQSITITGGGIIIFRYFQGQQMNREEGVALHRWLYRGERPNGLAKLMNKGWAVLHSLGIFPDYMVTLEVVGRQ
jgi:hypothetical protein